MAVAHRFDAPRLWAQFESKAQADGWTAANWDAKWRNYVLKEVEFRSRDQRPLPMSHVPSRQVPYQGGDYGRVVPNVEATKALLARIGRPIS